MGNRLETERIQYKIKLNCKSCGKEIISWASDLDSEIHCNNDSCRNSQSFEREDIEEVHFDTISRSPYYTVTVILLVDHRKQEFIPGGREASYGEHNVDFQQRRDDIIKFLRTNGNELSEEDTWRGYKFIDDFSRIGI